MELRAPTAEQIVAGTDPADAQFRLLVESVSDYAIFLLDPGGRVVSWNSGAERIKGYAAAEIIGRHFSLFYPPEDRAAGKPEAALQRAEREGRCQQEGWRLHKDGARFWADAVLTALRGPAGELRGFAKVTRDMTALRRQRENEALLQAFTRHSPSAMYLKDREGCYRFVNEQFLQRYGLRREQVIGRGDAELFAREQAQHLAERDAEVLARGAALQSEETARYAEGERHDLVSRFPVFDAAGGVVGVGGVATDITEAKAAEQALREQRALLAEAQKLAGLGCWEWDPSSGRLVWSEELYRIYGVDPGGFRPSFERYLERVHPEDRARAAQLVADALMERRGFSFEERIVRPDGAVRQLRSHGEVVYNAQGEVLKVVGACLDITEQKRAEALLRALTRRLVEAEETERRRIARELHDRVGQNLSALNINLDIVHGQLKDTACGPRLEDSLALVDATLQSIEHVMADLRPPLLDEYGIGAALAWYAEEHARSTGIRVSVDNRHAAGRALRPEAEVALFRIAQEALTNAAKHSAAKSIRVLLEDLDDEIVLSVSDDGKGFAPDQAPRGRWGMTTMRERAEAAGGRVAVESSPGKGATVRASVPL